MNKGLLLGGAALALGAAVLYGYRSVWYPVATRPKKGKPIIACVGDSITFGAGVKNRRRDSYPGRLQKELGKTVQVINYGMNGRTLLSTGDRPYIREKNYTRSFSDEPAVYLVLLGTNDAKPCNWNEAAYERELSDFLERYIVAVGKGHVIVMKPPRAFPAKNGQIKYDISEENIKKELSVIDRVAERLGVGMIDLHALTKHCPGWFADGVHPNAIGNKQIAQAVAETLRKEHRIP